jgi:hypothetical protein
MIKIAQNTYYELDVNPEVNRIFLKIKGAWSKTSEVPNYLTHWAQALTLVKPGFSILSDIRESNEHSMAVRALHLESQRMVIAAGISQLAEIHTLNEPASEQAIERAHECNLPLNIFDSLEDAEAWLAEMT